MTDTITKSYKLEFTARRAGALGISSSYTATRDASNLSDAIQALYDTYEHVHVTRAWLCVWEGTLGCEFPQPNWQPLNIKESL